MNDRTMKCSLAFANPYVPAVFSAQTLYWSAPKNVAPENSGLTARALS